MGKSVKAKNKNETAYKQAQHLLNEREQGYVPYDMLLTSIPLAEKTFPKRIVDELLHMIGHDFLWRRTPGYRKNGLAWDNSYWKCR